MHKIVIDGVTYTSAKQACVAIGLPYKTFLSRRREGKDVMDSLSLDKKKRTADHPNHPNHPKPYLYNQLNNEIPWS